MSKDLDYLPNCRVELSEKGEELVDLGSLTKGEADTLLYLRRNLMLDYEPVIDKFFGGRRQVDIKSLYRKGLVKLSTYPETTKRIDYP